METTIRYIIARRRIRKDCRVAFIRYVEDNGRGLYLETPVQSHALYFPSLDAAKEVKINLGPADWKIFVVVQKNQFAQCRLIG